jgi:hypothetical protein
LQAARRAQEWQGQLLVLLLLRLQAILRVLAEETWSTQYSAGPHYPIYRRWLIWWRTVDPDSVVQNPAGPGVQIREGGLVADFGEANAPAVIWSRRYPSFITTTRGMVLSLRREKHTLVKEVKKEKKHI